jgi:hypothetical protein
MAVVILDRLWFNLVSDIEQSLTFEGHANLQADTKLDGDLRQYGSARQRAVFGPHTERKWKVALTMADRFDLGVLASWSRQTVMFRDRKGIKIYGTWFDFRAEDWGHGLTVQNFNFDFVEISYDEGV